jgi:hypothetical protein
MRLIFSAALQAAYPIPQVPPGAQDAAEEPNEKDDPPPETLEAKVDIFLVTSSLWQDGQITPSIMLALRTNSSNWLPH